ncbi:FH2 domain-containing protein 1-like [Apteryx mantelli]|uniref:FH2 domain-containing protein 1-like n=1 Tax=Apteryx mantelli TaxID=2696672 RepID=A0ABM4DYU0_9AVES
MLPSAGEVARLRSFPGSPRQLADPELFMLLLTQVPSYARRLELLVLKEEFFPRLGALRTAIQTLTDAAVEVLECEELHAILHLVLRAGNYLNSGGYAGSAAGFRLASLLKLPDTKANEPGTDLLHFVAAEAAKAEKGLLDFPSKLPHVGPASRVEEAEVEGELRRLAERLARARGRPGEQGAGPQLQPFLRAADGELRAARGALEQLRRAAAAALDFYCEEAAPGGLQQLCAVLHRFAGRFLLAVQENRAREQAQRRRQQLERERQKRRSVATCSARDVAPRDAGTGRPFPGTPQPGRHPWLSPRPGAEPGPGGSPPASPGCGSPVLPLLRRHTAPALPALPRAPGCAEPPPATPALAPAGSTGGPSGHGTEPPAPAAAPAPGGPARFSLASLFQKKGAPPELGAPDPPQAPRDGSALLAFLRRLAGGRARGAPPS